MAKKAKRLNKKLSSLLSKGPKWIMPVFVRAFGLVVLVGLGWLALYQMEACVQSLDEYKVSSETFKIEQKPSWVKSDIERSLRRLPAARGDYSLMERGLTERLAESYRQSPWVSKVRSVRRDFPNTIHLELELRRPYALIRKKHTYYLVDKEGVRLPRRYYAWPGGRRNSPFIYGIASRAPVPGKKWKSADVAAGVAVLKALRSKRLATRLHITAIDVSNLGGRISSRESEILLWTEDQSKIAWGRSPLRDSPGELPVSDKLDRLSKLASREMGRLDRFSYVELRFPRELTVVSNR